MKEQIFINFFFDRIHLGKDDPKYADALLDFGFYLLNVDSIVQSVDVYKVCIMKPRVYLIVVKIVHCTSILDSYCTH